MTIKKRLLISNILMIIIPAVVGMTATLGAAKVCKQIIYRQVVTEIYEKQSDFENKPHRGNDNSDFYGIKDYHKSNDYMLIDSSSNERDKIIILFIGGLVFLVTAGSILITNRFLTKFVFNKIEKPIDILVEGVTQIKDGNLDYKIDYEENDEFLPVCNAFNDMASRLKESVDNTQRQEQNRKELIAGISHDIRTPLTSINAYIEGLLDNVAATPEMQQKYMHTIKQKAKDIDNMVDKLFMFSKLDLGEYPFYPEKIDIALEINKILDENKKEYIEKGLNINVTDPQNNLTVFADPVQFRNAVINILENSAKYKNKDTVNVDIKYFDEDDFVKIAIEDDGPGVEEKALSKLFDVFYRNDPSRNNPSKGSGLGLAITAKIIEKFNGSIYAENVSPTGLRIVFTLPKREGI